MHDLRDVFRLAIGGESNRTILEIEDAALGRHDAMRRCEQRHEMTAQEAAAACDQGCRGTRSRGACRQCLADGLHHVELDLGFAGRGDHAGDGVIERAIFAYAQNSGGDGIAARYAEVARDDHFIAFFQRRCAPLDAIGDGCGRIAALVDQVPDVDQHEIAARTLVICACGEPVRDPACHLRVSPSGTATSFRPRKYHPDLIAEGIYRPKSAQLADMMVNLIKSASARR